uniref:Uncharacterized protein n=1 Tax=Rhizophora mucronata TaxID=61149 RepID=A0A2P2QY55_RHIMU
MSTSKLPSCLHLIAFYTEIDFNLKDAYFTCLTLWCSLFEIQ